MMSEERAYSLEFNGETTGFFVSIKEALLTRSWDVVTLQQCSPQSFRIESYRPYLATLSEYVSKLCPKAKQMLHMTWGYANGYDRLAALGFSSHEEMFAAVREANKTAAAEIGADLIPSGEAVAALLRAGAAPEQVHRDGFHLGLGLGRYAVGLLWYAALTGKDIASNSFCDFDRPVSEEEIALAKATVRSVLA